MFTKSSKYNFLSQVSDVEQPPKCSSCKSFFYTLFTLKMYNNSKKYIPKSYEVLPFLILFILLDVWMPWGGFQDYQFASNCVYTSAVLLRVESDENLSKLFVEYNDNTTGLPTEGVIRKIGWNYSRSLTPGHRIGILYLSGMYRVYMPDFSHPNYKSAIILYGFGELGSLWLTFIFYRAYKSTKAQERIAKK